MPLEFFSLLIAIATTSATVSWKISQMEGSLQQKLNNLHELMAARLAEIERNILLDKQQDDANLENLNLRISNLETFCQEKLADLRQQLKDLQARLKE